MAGRRLPPEGAWVPVPTSLRSAHVDLLDAARGDVTRSEWVRGVVLAALGVTGGPVWERPAAERPGPEFEERRIEQELTAASVPQAFPDDPPKRPRKPGCKHPGVGKKMRCPACGQYNV